jgi:hypothetical protein
MATAEDARRDLTEKLRFERELATEMRAFNKRLTREMVRLYGVDQAVLRADQLEPELNEILFEHYKAVGDEFDDQIAPTLPADIAETSEERAAIAAALSLFYSQRAPEQSGIITATNQRDIDTSISTAVELESTTQELVSSRTIAITAGVLLSRKLAGRVVGISTLETQAIAEAAKATEVQVLTGQPPSVTGGTLRESPVSKEWVTVGDERVREAHVLADSQTQTLNKPFNVGGDLLRWPGDTSLGAQAGNVINCRCSSVVSKEDVFAERRRRGESPFFETVPTEQLLTSLGV